MTTSVGLRDAVAVRNERVKLFANFLNTVGLGLIGFAVLRPITEDVSLLSLLSVGWGAGGFACHAAAHYVLGRLVKEHRDDDP